MTKKKVTSDFLKNELVDAFTDRLPNDFLKEVSK
jgi:hypothetical protein